MNPPVPRKNYGALFEPVDTVLHGAGQSADAFRNYCAALGSQLHPAVFMYYCGLKKMAAGSMAAMENYHQRHPEVEMIPQIGLSMTTDGTPEEHYEHHVAAGEYDVQIGHLIENLRNYGKPLFLRIGYEFNGHWNGYQAETFVAAWKRVVEAIRAARLDNVATVWCYAEDGADKDYRKFYPGDAYVDWWGIDLFAPAHLSAPGAMRFLADAEQHGKPVMIGESTARRVGVHGAGESWDLWFAPYFGLIRSHPGVKAFCYINWNWASYPMWHDWGDCRIEENAVVLERYRREMAQPLYQHAKTRTYT